MSRDLFIGDTKRPDGFSAPTYQKASVAEVVVWLREQGAGEEDRWCVAHHLPLAPGWSCCLSQMWTGAKATCDVVKVLVIPLDTESPKESE